MRAKMLVSVIGICSLLVATLLYAQQAPKEPITLKLGGAKQAPVSFSHSSHIDKAKIDCAKCHHKDKDARNPQKCTECHGVKEAKDNAPLAKDAFHKQCRDCHKGLSKEVKAPTKCNECHKK